MESGVKENDWKKKNVILLGNLEESGEIMQCFELGKQIAEYGKTNVKKKLVHQ